MNTTTTTSPLAASVIEVGTALSEDVFQLLTPFDGAAEGKVGAICDFGDFIKGRISAETLLDRIHFSEQQQDECSLAYLETLKALISL